MKQWPKIDSTVTFTGTRVFWFADMVKDANELLELGREYTVAKLELASSWCGVILTEFPEHTFSLSWFAYNHDLTTKEELMIEGKLIPLSKEEIQQIKESVVEARNDIHPVCKI